MYNSTGTSIIEEQLFGLGYSSDKGVSIFLWTSLLSLAVYLASRIVYRNALTDKKGAAIPDGPMGLPILGI